MAFKVIYGFANAKKDMARRGSSGLPTLADYIVPNSDQMFGECLSAGEIAVHIVKDVKTRGDEAVHYYTQLLDGVELDALEVSSKLIDEAITDVDKSVLEALKMAAGRIHSYHKSTIPSDWMSMEKGLGERFVPLERAGVYAPGGTACYASTVLMTAIPARVAGVKEIILCTPSIDNVVLAAASVAGVDRVFRVGGAQAIGAMAYGTDTIPNVDMICGPGNIFVTMAKKFVYGDVGIDGLYGPTETVIIADHLANPTYCVADLLAQAEHDAMATPILITTSQELLENVQLNMDEHLNKLERRDIASAAVNNNGRIVLVDTLDEAIELANLIAPEHLCLLIEDAWDWADKIVNAGGLFIGESSPEVAGDYIAGPSHVMPTGGTSRYSSALGVRHFLKTMPIINLNLDTLTKIGKAASAIARSEGLTGHALAMDIRLNNMEENFSE